MLPDKAIRFVLPEPCDTWAARLRECNYVLLRSVCLKLAVKTHPNVSVQPSVEKHSWEFQWHD